MRNSRNTNLADALTDLFHSRAPHQELIRGTLGDGQGNVVYATLADTCYVRIRGAQASVVLARNITVPMQNNIAVDLRRLTDHSKTLFTVVGLTQGYNVGYGEQPWANVTEHGYTHGAGGYDPIGRDYRTVFVATNYTVLSDDELLLVDTGAAHTVFLPDATSVIAGHPLTIKDATGTAAGNNITLSPFGTQTIDQVAGVLAMNTNKQVVRLVSNGANWLVV